MKNEKLGMMRLRGQRNSERLAFLGENWMFCGYRVKPFLLVKNSFVRSAILWRSGRISAS